MSHRFAIVVFGLLAIIAIGALLLQPPRQTSTEQPATQPVEQPAPEDNSGESSVQ